MIELAHCNIHYRPYGVRVVFPDGAFADGTPHDTVEYRLITMRCGYGDDIMAYCREHDACHAIWAEFVHHSPSKVLRGIATGKMLSGAESVEEEMGAQLLQRWVRTQERPIISGLDFYALRRFALEKLDGA
jgi:hypothetical protein